MSIRGMKAVNYPFVTQVISAIEKMLTSKRKHVIKFVLLHATVESTVYQCAPETE